MGLIPIKQFTNDLADGDLENKGSINNQYLQEGRYNVKVVEVTEPQPNDFDQSWYECSLTVANDIGKISRYDLFIPTSKLTTRLSDGSESSFRARDLNRFCLAVFGEPLPKEEVSPFLRRRIGDVSKLIGAKFECTVGHPYGRAHSKRVGGAIKIFDATGKVLEPDFATFKEVEDYVKEHKIKFSKFPRVIDVHPKKTADSDDAPN